MNLRNLLARYSKGELSIDDLQKKISIHSIEQVANNLARLDVDREIRKEIPEVIFARGKKYADLLEITTTAVHRTDRVVISKIQPGQLSRVCRALKKRKLDIEVGKNSSTILVYSSTSSISTAIDNSSSKGRSRDHHEEHHSHGHLGT